MDTAQWQQGIGVVRPAAADQNPRPAEKKPRPDQTANCPRCNSTNTKFCYYNNYSLSQPRYFCKTCRRYWTEGGALRNVPVGGGSRRKHKSSSSPSISSSKKSPTTDLTPPTPTPTPDQNPKFSPIYNGVPQLVANLPFAPQNPSFMDLLKTTGGTSVIDPATSVFCSSSVFSSGLIPVHEFENGFGGLQPTVQDQTRTGFTFEEPKPVELDRGGLPLDSNGYWNGVQLPGGSW